MIPLVAIVGPTGVGKTALAIRLAQQFNGEIVSADSRQVYRRMEIGTAKPSREEQAAARHHLLDVVEPDTDFSVALYQKLATDAIADIHDRGKLPLLVGGTGHYVKALLEGFRLPRVSPNEPLRRELAAIAAQPDGLDRLNREYAVLDPVGAARIDSRNPRRVIRAIEVTKLTGVPFSQASSAEPPPYRTLILGLTMPRGQLNAALDARVDRMLAAGWVDEVRALLAVGYSLDSSALSSLGYGSILAHLRGELTLEEAAAQAKVLTRRFAHRQYAWFKPSDPRIHWLDVTAPGAQAQAAELVASFVQ